MVEAGRGHRPRSIGRGLWLWQSRHLSPERLFILSFAGVILAGSLLLRLPCASAAARVGWVDAVFQSTSAVCVTGLASIDVGRDLSTAGQVVLVLLFQVGGLGILTFSAAFFVILGHGLGSKERDVMQSTFLHAPRRDLAPILRFVLVSTFAFEAVGALLLWLAFARDYPWGEALYKAVFHAVSAFNNCGFSLFADSLTSYQGDALVNLTVIGLVLAGGIGFVVHYELHQRLTGRRRRLSLHTRLVLVVSAVLVAGGAVLFYLFERGRLLAGLPWSSQLLASLFQSVTPRTAGFHTVAIASLANETVLLMLGLMFVGASPGSTGGGVKTTSAGLLFLMMSSRLKGAEEVNAFGRTIPREVLQRTLSIILVAALSVCLVVSVLLLLPAAADRTPAEARQRLVEYVFETMSAFGTVGLSMDLTPRLSALQKLAVAVMMFVGRVGPLTLAFSLARRIRKTTVAFAEEGVMVG